MKKLQLNKKAARHAIWSSLSRVISAALGAGAGVFAHQAIGDSALSWSLAGLMFAASVLFMFYAEYNKNLDRD